MQFTMRYSKRKLVRTGATYIAVLGTALLVALLGITALVGQRIQNRIVTASADIRQAELNANTAVELALLAMKQEPNWRSSRPNGNWFISRSTGAGTCSANVTDPVDGNLATGSTDPIVVLGIGYYGDAQQRFKLAVDAFREPIASLRSAVAAGDSIALNADTLRTNGLITANQITANSSQVYGNVEAVTISGSTYNGTNTLITSARLPAMPNWASVFNYYRTNGTEIDYGSLDSTPSTNFVRNWTFNDEADDWTGIIPGPSGQPTAELTDTNNWSRTASMSLRVRNRTAWNAGAVQRIEHFVKPGKQYNVSAWVNVPGLIGVRSFRMWLVTKGTGSAEASVSSGSVSLISVLGILSANINSQLTAPAWTGDLEYAYIKVSDATSSGSTNEFYLDDVEITEVASGRYIYRKVLSPNVNTLYPLALTNQSQGKTHGIYWINCNSQRLTIERSRILGTLLVVNPGAGSSIAHGPISWAPAVAGYPALLVDADNANDANFTIAATNRGLSENEQLVNYNPTGAAHPELGQDSDTNDIYQSKIEGLVAIEGNLLYQNRPFIRGQVLIGDDLLNSSGSLEVDFQPESLLSPPPGFLAPNTFQRRPASAHKTVLP